MGFAGRDLMPTTNHRDTTLTTDSRRVAKHFKKRHDHVLRAFDNLKCSAEYRRLNYEETVEHRENPSVGAPIARVRTPAVGVPKFWVPIRNAGLSHQPLAEVTHPIGGSHHGCWQNKNRHTPETTAWK